MTQLLTGSFQLMKSLNRSLILNMIREKGPISRAEIAKLTKLTPPTVSNLVKELLESGIVLESDLGESNGGRKPTMLVIHAKNFYIIGLDIGSQNIKIVITDLNARIIERKHLIIPSRVTNDELLSLIKDEIHQIISLSKINNDKIIGIGVGMHGMVDTKNGVALFAPNLHLREIPIKETLENEFDTVVKIENDVRAMALGELWFGNGNGANNIIGINVGRGVGAGIIFNGKLFHGQNQIAGEIGHMTIDVDGPRCSCGNYGCLQSFVSGPAIAEKVKNEIAVGRESIVSQLVEGKLDEITGEIVHHAAQQGDQLSIGVLEQTGRYLGIGLTNIINIVNPERIIIGGGVSKAGDFVLKKVTETIQQRALTPQAKETKIELSKLGDDATVVGAVSLILVELFSV